MTADQRHRIQGLVKAALKHQVEERATFFVDAAAGSGFMRTPAVNPDATLLAEAGGGSPALDAGSPSRAADIVIEGRMGSYRGFAKPACVVGGVSRLSQQRVATTSGRRMGKCKMGPLGPRHLCTGLVLVLLTACTGCQNLGLAAQLMIRRISATSGVPDQLVFRSGVVEPHVVIDSIWMDLCDYDGIKSIEVFQQGALVGQCEKAKRFVPSHARVPGSINYCARVKGVVDGRFTVKLRSIKNAETEYVFEKLGTVIKPIGSGRPTWPHERTGLRIGNPVAAPFDSGVVNAHRSRLD